jgi:hypothetical protein
MLNRLKFNFHPKDKLLIARDIASLDRDDRLRLMNESIALIVSDRDDMHKYAQDCYDSFTPMLVDAKLDPRRKIFGKTPNCYFESQDDYAGIATVLSQFFCRISLVNKQKQGLQKLSNQR